jgi:hypothetical protein
MSSRWMVERDERSKLNPWAGPSFEEFVVLIFEKR